MIIKAQSPAGFAEEYIVKSIWNNKFPAGSILPAERELSELIGVTRTTLREVLQRLARDGWLTIQHGKPTRVNNFWETSGLNILETMARLDQDGVHTLVDQLLSARTNIGSIFICKALQVKHPEVVALLEQAQHISNDAKSFADYDYLLNHTMAFNCGNPIYTLILNGFKNLYKRVGRFYFESEQGRDLARDYYIDLLALLNDGNYEQSPALIRRYGRESGKIWQSMREQMPKDIAEQKIK